MTQTSFRLVRNTALLCLSAQAISPLGALRQILASAKLVFVMSALVRPFRALARALRPRHVLYFVLFWILATCITLAFGIFQAYKGKNEIEIVQTQLTKSPADISLARAHLKQASKYLRQSHLAIDNPLTYPWRAIPWADTQLSSASALTGFGDRACRATTKGFANIEARYPGILNSSRTKRSEITNNKADMFRQIGAITATMHRDIGSFNIGPSENVVKPLAQAREVAEKYAQPLDTGLSQASGSANGLASLLTENKRYVLFAANTTEARDGSGMFLSAGLLQTGNNTLKLDHMESTGNLKAPDGSIVWPEDLGNRWNFLPKRHMVQDLMMSPRFDANAPIAAEIWNKAKGDNVDGVIVVDVEFLRAIIAATGPITVGDTTFNAENVIRQLSWEQYVRLESSTGDLRRQILANPSRAEEIMTNAERRDVLSELATTAFARVAEQKWDPLTFAQEASKAAKGRHFLAWSKDDATNAYWKTAGVSGELVRDSMMVSIANFGGNKLDQFLVINSSLATNKTSAGIECTLKITVKNSAPATGPQYVLGPYPGLPWTAGQYNGFLTVNLPGDSTQIRYAGNPQLMAYGHDGPTQLISTPINLRAGETREFTLQFVRSKNAARTVVEPSGRIPASTWEFRDLTWKDDHTKVLYQ